MKGDQTLVVLGGGSVWTLHLLAEISALAYDDRLQIRLQGPTEQHLLQNAAFARSLNRRLDLKTVVNLDEAVSGATIILNQVRIGGWPTRLDDEILPVQLGAVGDESLGLGGVRAAFRSLTFVVELARVIRREAPDAWLLNLTNPCDILGQAFRWAGVKKVLGLCDHPQMLAREMASLAGRPEAYSRFGFIGLNHIGWLQPPIDMDLRRLLTKRPELELWQRQWGLLPTDWRMHLAQPARLVRQQQSAPGQRALQLIGLNQKLRQCIHRQDAAEYNSLLRFRNPSWYREIVIPALRGVLGEEPIRLIAGLPNGRRLSGLDRHAQIETWTGLQFGDAHPEPLPQNTNCLKDIAEIGHIRALAFQAIRDADLDALTQYVNNDPLSRPVLDHPDWQKRLGFSDLANARFDKMMGI